MTTFSASAGCRLPCSIVIGVGANSCVSKSTGSGSGAAKTIEPDKDYIIPLGKGRVTLTASDEAVAEGRSCVVITYGMGVYWAREAARSLADSVTVVDLRTLNPLDWELITSEVRKHSRAMVLSEEPLQNSFAESLAGRISKHCFQINFSNCYAIS